ncbi:MAG: hypothetical protein NW241_16820 [Bacteroidia bacterium]|nr:hypothetical protein [Bacteroidia bacterium]
MQRSLFTLLMLLALAAGLRAQEPLMTGSKVVVSSYVPETGSAFDRTGRQHNQALETIGAATGWRKLSGEELKAQLYPLMTADYPAKADFDRLYTRNEQEFAKYETAVKQGTEPAFWQSLGADPASMAFVLRLKALIRAAAASANDSVVRAIRLLQREIAASAIPQAQKDALMSGAAVGCYSLDYWTQKFSDAQFLGQLDAEAVRVHHGTTIFFPPPPSIKVIKGSGGPSVPDLALYYKAAAKTNGQLVADVAISDVIGGLIGGFLGSAIPGAGTVAGALQGAVRGSGGAVIKILVTTPVKN